MIGFFLSLIILVSIIFIGLFVSLKKPLTKAKIIFSAFVFSAAFWVFTNFMVDIAKVEKSLLFWSKLTIVGVIFFPIFFWKFSLLFPTPLSYKKIKEVLIWISAVILLIFVPTSYNIKEVEPISGDVPMVKIGILYFTFLIYLITILLFAFLNLIKNYRRSTGVSRQQLKYVIIGVIFSVIGGATTNLILLLFGLSKFANLGPLFLLIFIVFTFYAIIRYRFLDLRFILRKTAIYIISTVVVATPVIVLSTLLYSYNLFSPVIITILSVLAAVLILRTVRSSVEKLANKYFFFSLVDYQEIIREITDKLSATLELERVIDTIFSTIGKTMHIEKIALLTQSPKGNKYYIQKAIGFKKEQVLGLNNNLFLREYLTFTKAMLIGDEINAIADRAEDVYTKKELLSVKNEMAENDIAALLPAISKDELISIIVLGHKISKDSFHINDVELLETLTNQAAVAIENAQLYKELQKFNIKLREEVERQTKALSEANVKLKRMDQLKSEFISIVSHQLRTPLSGMKGYLYMLTGGDFGKMPEQIQKILVEMKENTDKLIWLIRDFLDISQIESETLKLEIKPDKIEPVIEKAIAGVLPAAKKKGLAIIFEKPAAPFPKLMIDADKTSQVMMNLIDNAVKYTEKGKIIISGKIDRKKRIFILNIKDTGIGIDKEEAGQLFQKFVRGKGISQVEPGGRGLGLYVVKMITEAQHGRVWVESAGKGKGSEFFVELPLA